MEIVIKIEKIEEFDYRGELTVVGQKEIEPMISKWGLDPLNQLQIKEKGIDLEMLAAYNIGKQLLADFCRPRMYPVGDPKKTPRQRVREAQEKVKKPEEVEEE